MENTKVSLVKINNILGITELELKAGKFTTITGANGTGKSSVMKAIQSVFKGGHDATLLRNGAEVGEVVLVLDDGTHIKKTISKDKSDLKATGQSKAKTYLESISDLTSVNPISFLSGDDATRLKILLESMPIELPVARLKEILGEEELPDGAPLVVLDKVRKTIYDKRTGENRAVKEKSAAIRQLEATLPPLDMAQDTDIQSELDKAEADYAEKVAKKDAYQNDLNKSEKEKTAELNKNKENTIAHFVSEREKELEKIRQEYAKRINETEVFFEEKKVAVQAEYKSDLETLLGAFNDYSIPKLREIAALKEAVKHEAVTKNTREAIAMQKSELQTYEEEAERLDKALTDIDTIRKNLLSKTPFPNVTVVDRIIYVDGVRFTHLNTAQQVAFALRIAKLRAGKLGLVCLDNMECLDKDTLSYFKEAAAASDLQFIITRVGESDLTITNN